MGERFNPSPPSLNCTFPFINGSHRAISFLKPPMDKTEMTNTTPHYIAYASVNTGKVDDDGHSLWRRTRIGVAYVNTESDKWPITVLSDVWRYRVDVWPPWEDNEKPDTPSPPGAVRPHVAYASVNTGKIDDDGKPVWRRTRIGVAFINTDNEKRPVTIVSDLWNYRVDLWPPWEDDKDTETVDASEIPVESENPPIPENLPVG